MTKTRKDMRSYVIELAEQCLIGAESERNEAVAKLRCLALLLEDAAAVSAEKLATV